MKHYMAEAHGRGHRRKMENASSGDKAFVSYILSAAGQSPGWMSLLNLATAHPGRQHRMLIRPTLGSCQQNLKHLWHHNKTEFEISLCKIPLCGLTYCRKRAFFASSGNTARPTQLWATIGRYQGFQSRKSLHSHHTDNPIRNAE